MKINVLIAGDQDVKIFNYRHFNWPLKTIIYSGARLNTPSSNISLNIFIIFS
jgi:hypothetical protein